MYKLLIIDDEATICNSLKFALEDDYDVDTATNYYELEHHTKSHDYDIVLLDLRFGDIQGTELIPKLKSEFVNCAIIVMTAYASIESSVKAIKLGAYDYLIKPIEVGKLKFDLKRCIQFKQLNEKISYLEQAVIDKNKRQSIIGKSKAVERIYDQIDKVKNLDCSVLIEGASGTGKELVAREIHFSGSRRCQPFEVVNCAAIPANLVESELFGYEKGAFTGALNRKKGRFELADKGTLFLDEITEMDLLSQVKLLRAIQDKEIYPLGAESAKTVDVRIVAATNRDIQQVVKRGEFREDLYFRLNVVTIKTPNLKERREDLYGLIVHFIELANSEYKKSVKGITSHALNMLENYDFPGNVRELKNIVNRAVIFATSDLIDIAALPDALQYNQHERGNQIGVVPVAIGTSLADANRQIIQKTLIANGGNRKQTAKVLGISERNLRYKLKEYQLDS